MAAARRTAIRAASPTGCRASTCASASTERTFLRFAYSRAMSRPDIGLLRNYVQINSPVINTSPDSPYVVYNSPTAAHIAANVTGYNFVFQANAGQCRAAAADGRPVRPVVRTLYGPQLVLHRRRLLQAADQQHRLWPDHAQLHQQRLDPDRPDQRAAATSSDGGSLSGFEAAYQTFFTFLPGPFDGLGHAAQLHLRPSVGDQELEPDHAPRRAATSAPSASACRPLAAPGR